MVEETTTTRLATGLTSFRSGSNWLSPLSASEVHWTSWRLGCLVTTAGATASASDLSAFWKGWRESPFFFLPQRSKHSFGVSRLHNIIFRHDVTHGHDHCSNGV